MKVKIALSLAGAALLLSLWPRAGRADIFDAIVICQVRGIRQGQLAVRPAPNGQPFAGLDNGNIVRAFGGTLSQDGTPWYEIRVLQGPNARVEGRQGFVNARYLRCRWYDENGTLIRED
ncbi:MAG: hypothetical protein EA366_06435 [Spirulina sp. DLM2.Bin59]|nr:MAG: hypothetical protein EA366_06435 [Spirulina sp. DLM2.Bin59]